MKSRRRWIPRQVAATVQTCCYCCSSPLHGPRWSQLLEEKDAGSVFSLAQSASLMQLGQQVTYTCMCSISGVERQCLNGQRKRDWTADLLLSFPLGDELPPPGLHVRAQVLYHAVDEVVEGQAASLRLNGQSADGALVPPLAPLADAIVTKAMRAAQSDRLHRRDCRDRAN